MASKYKTPLEIMAIFCFLRVVESQTLTLLCGDKDVRYRFLKQALKNGWLKESIIQKRERTTHRTTLYSLSKKGLIYVCQSSPASFFKEMAAVAYALSVFQKDEYSDDARLRLSGLSTAVIVASEGGASLPVEVFNRRYSFSCEEEDDDLLNSEDESSIPDTLREYFHIHLTEDKYVELGLFGADAYYNGNHKMYFLDALFVKQALSGTNNPKEARDFYKGRFRGIIQSEKQTLLVYTAPLFGMSWAEWVVKPEMKAIMAWNKRYSGPTVKYSHEYSAVLIVKNLKQFVNLYRDVDHVRKPKEVFGGQLDHVYVVEQTELGARVLAWLMRVSSKDVLDFCAQEIISGKLGEHNSQPSRDIFHFRDNDGNEAMCGLRVDAKQVRELEIWAQGRGANSVFSVFCRPYQVPYYLAIMPPNVRCIPIR